MILWQKLLQVLEDIERFLNEMPYLQQNFMERNIGSCIRSILVLNIENKERIL